jgi:hypothetical protein
MGLDLPLENRRGCPIHPIMKGMASLAVLAYLVLCAAVGDASPQVLCSTELQENALPQTGYIGIWTDANHSDCDVYPGLYTAFDAYIWCLPSVNGLIAAEFAVSFPPTVVTIATVQHPDIMVSLGSLASGISVAFGEGTCKRDWVWTHHVTCLSMANTASYIGIIPHPATMPQPAYQFASCLPGYPIEPCINLSRLYVNQSCGCIPPLLPQLTSVIVESNTAIRAVFDMCVWGTAPPYLFVLYKEANPLDTIGVAQATSVADNEYELVLQGPMIDSTTYILAQRSYVWSCSEGYYSHSQFTFTFLEATATLLQSCSTSLGGAGIDLAWELSEVDAGVEFFVSRSENGAGFIALDMAALARDGLRFTYSDSRVEPGSRYVYKVEYTLDGKSRLLFLSEEIRTPAALLALEQNRPNPFNPSTTISFSLPAECPVRLEVYDVSGRLVARLVDGAKLSAGPHDVEWNGRDGSGRAAASGIYIYRLVAGKDMLSRKMVLLR